MQGKEETEGSTGGRVRQACAQTLREAQRCAPALGFSENNPKPPNTGTALGLPARLRDSHVELLV